MRSGCVPARRAAYARSGSSHGRRVLKTTKTSPGNPTAFTRVESRSSARPSRSASRTPTFTKASDTNFPTRFRTPPGRYAAALYFWEYWWGKGRPGNGGAGSRRFDSTAITSCCWIDFDIVRDSGSEQAVKKTFRGLVPNVQGKLEFSFVPRNNNALVNAIEIQEDR